jgi:hypothetical protein
MNVIWSSIESSPTTSAIISGLVVALLIYILKRIKKKTDNDGDILPKSYGNDSVLEKLNLTEDSSHINLTRQQKVILRGVNKFHKLMDMEYNFEPYFKEAIMLYTNKPNSFWFSHAANQVVDCIQTLGIDKLFSSFNLEDLEIRDLEEFEQLKTRITYLYSDILMKLKHNDKKKELPDEFISTFDRRIKYTEEIDTNKYEEVFKIFEEDLFFLFTKFDLKEKE